MAAIVVAIVAAVTAVTATIVAAAIVAAAIVAGAVSMNHFYVPCVGAVSFSVPVLVLAACG